MPLPCSMVAATRWSGRSSRPPPRPSRRRRPARCRTPRADLETYIGLVGRDNPSVEPLDRQLLVAVAAELDAARRQAHVAAAVSTHRRREQPGQHPETFTLTLAAREGTIPLTIRNDSGMPLRVSVRLRSQKLDFPEGETIPLVLAERVDAHRHPRARPHLRGVPPADRRRDARWPASPGHEPLHGAVHRRVRGRASCCRSAPACSSWCGGPATGTGPGAAPGSWPPARTPPRGQPTRLRRHGRPHRHRQQLRPHRRGGRGPRHRGGARCRSASATTSTRTAAS